jgi:site-specific DNA-methyltransferase (adenine-specific)
MPMQLLNSKIMNNLTMRTNLINKKYKIIYADPPWAYNESGSGNRVVKSKYPTMQIEDIIRLPINEIADDDCVLFIWVTFPRLPEGLKVIEEWGFKYKGLAFNWVKKNKKSDSTAYAVYKWVKDYSGPTELKWLDWNYD